MFVRGACARCLSVVLIVRCLYVPCSEAGPPLLFFLVCVAGCGYVIRVVLPPEVMAIIWGQSPECGGGGPRLTYPGVD